MPDVLIGDVATAMLKSIGYTFRVDLCTDCRFYKTQEVANGDNHTFCRIAENIGLLMISPNAHCDRFEPRELIT
jgi:hypothetical protein